MLLRDIFTGKIAHTSYILAGSQTCAVIDPRRDVDIYIQAAREMGVTITHILETHLHADFISGHMDLARRTGAPIYAPRSADCDFDHIAIAEGDSIVLEDMRLDVLETPGHTPEHISYVLTDNSRGVEPAGVFVGDTMFVGDVGRPDLFPNRAEELATRLYHSLHDKLLRLPDFCEVYPAHGAGSLCGRAISARRRTTIGYERLYNPALQIEAVPDFVRSLTSDMPPAPDHFSRCSEINRQGPALVAELPVPAGMDAATFKARRQEADTLVLDIRGYDAFAGHHIPGAWHIDQDGNLPVFAGWVLPTDRDILLVAERNEDVAPAATWARRVGVDRITGYLNNGMPAWVASGLATGAITLIDAPALRVMLKGDSDAVLVDVRSAAELESGRIEGALHIPAPDLRTRYVELDPAAETILICSSGNRSSMAASLLKQHGFDRVSVVAGGMAGWSAAG